MKFLAHIEVGARTAGLAQKKKNGEPPFPGTLATYMSSYTSSVKGLAGSPRSILNQLRRAAR